jgi:hypothetical protein
MLMNPVATIAGAIIVPSLGGVVAPEGAGPVLQVDGSGPPQTPVCPCCDLPVAANGCHACVKCGLDMHGMCGTPHGGNEMQRICIMCLALLKQRVDSFFAAV